MPDSTADAAMLLGEPSSTPNNDCLGVALGGSPTIGKGR